MARKILSAFGLCLLVLSSSAQDPAPFNNNGKPESDGSIENQLDSLLISYYNGKIGLLSNQPKPDSSLVEVASLSDSILELRLEAINSFIPLDFNSRTRRFIEVYTVDKRKIVPLILGLSDYYFPIFEASIDRYQLPVELKYLPVIESALKPNAVSKAGAVGLWQFMYGTAKMNGLHIDSYVDERRDPRKASDAACKYLSDLYNMFGDWQLAIAAYNCGPGNVNKAIRRSGGKRNFWELYNYLPRETRGYVPAFIAANYVFSYYDAHDIRKLKIDMPRLVDTVLVEQMLHLKDLSNQTGVSMEVLRDLNPQYRRDIVPAKEGKPYSIVLPLEYCLAFCDYSDTLKSLFNARIDRTTTPISSSYSKPSGSYVTYTVKSGDNLGYIADWFDTYVSRIKNWNNLYSSRIRVGQRLVIYVDPSKKDYYSSINSMSLQQKKSISSHSSFSNTSKLIDKDAETFVYTFKKGDSLWRLSQLFPGNTVAKIMALNGISNANNIQPGEKITLYR